MNYLGAHEEILIQLEELMRKSRPFEKMYKDFEAKLICYLPLNTFLLKPAQRLLHYRLILDRMTFIHMLLFDGIGQTFSENSSHLIIHLFRFN